MPVPDDFQKSLSRLLLEHCRVVYGELTDTWRGLEAKAQGATAIVGIFLAGAFVLASRAESLGPIEKSLLLLAVGVLVAAAVVALFSLRVRTFDTLEDIDSARDAARAVIETEDNADAQARIRKYVLDRVAQWRDASEALREQNHSKAGALGASQSVIILGAVLLLAVFGASLFPGKLPGGPP